MKDVCFSHSESCILHDINLTLSKGEYAVVLGPNGGGKTTLIKLLLGLCRPQCGEIKVLGLEPSLALNRLGYLQQNFNMPTGFPITVIELTMTGLLGTSWQNLFYNKKERLTAEAALDKVGMLPYKDRLLSSLSGGQKQRAFIARAIVSQPEMLLLDEPTSNVDHEGKEILYNFLAEINEDATIIMVSHDISVIPSAVTSILCVNRTMYHHKSSEITPAMLGFIHSNNDSCACPVELFAHPAPIVPPTRRQD